MEFHKTKDILHVMRVLGHKNINNTLVYTQLVDFKDDDYTAKIAASEKFRFHRFFQRIAFSV